MQNLFDHSIEADYIVNAMDHDTTFTKEQRGIFKEWVLIAILRARRSATLLEAGSEPAPSTADVAATGRAPASASGSPTSAAAPE